MDKRYEILEKHLREKGYEGEALSKATNQICRELETLGFGSGVGKIPDEEIPGMKYTRTEMLDGKPVRCYIEV